MTTSVRCVMSKRPATIHPTATAQEALERMVDERLSELYVVDAEGRLLGVLPDYELLKCLLVESLAQRSVGELTCRELSSCDPDTPVESAARLLREGHTRRVAVVEDGRLLGWIGRHEVMVYMADRTVETDPAMATQHSAGKVAAPHLPRTQQATLCEGSSPLARVLR